MSMYARHNPEAYEQSGHDGIYDALVASVDSAEKEPCQCCGERLVRFHKLCTRCERERRADREGEGEMA